MNHLFYLVQPLVSLNILAMNIRNIPSLRNTTFPKMNLPRKSYYNVYLPEKRYLIDYPPS
jgi:hypothetical protein